jgi:hypothetical protein
MRNILERLAPLASIPLMLAAAGAPPVQWMKTFAGLGSAYLHCVQQTSDGGFVAAGLTSDTGRSHAYLVKTDSLGNSEWEKTYAGYRSIGASSVQQTADGGYIMVGDGRLLPDAPWGRGPWLMKTDATGNLEWQTLAGGNETLLYGYSVVQTEDLGYAVGVVTAQDSGVALIKVDSLGALEWLRRYPLSYHFCRDEPISLRRTADKGYVLGTKTLLKVDSLGNQQWLRTYQGIVRANSAIQTSDGGYAATGLAEGNTPEEGRYYLYLLKTDSLGNLQWNKKYPGSIENDGSCVEQTADGGYVIACDGTYGPIIIKTDGSGNMSWSQSALGGPDGDAYCLCQTRDGGYIVTGLYYNPTTNDVLCFLAKLATGQ